MKIKESKKEKININENDTCNNGEVALNNEQITSVKTSKKRDATIELIRIVACIIVVATHLSLNVFDQYHSQVDWSRLFEKCFLTDGVPVFYMIIGFFLVNGRSYKKIWKSTAKKVLLPTLFYVIFAQIFFMFILNKQSFLWCIQNAGTNLNLQGIFRSIITGNVLHINSLCAHLWYIFSYVKIVIWIPILWIICKEENNSKLARRIILGFGILATIIKDVQRFVTLPIGEIKALKLVDIDLIYVLLGYELFIHKDKIKNNKKVCLISLLVFGLINVIRYKIEMKYMVLNNFYEITGRENFLDWKYTFLNIVSGLSLFAGLYSLDVKNEKLSKIILWIADKTFGIYLIHYLLLAKIDLYKFDKIGTIVYEMIYLVIGVTVIFTASLLITWLLKKVKEIFCKICSKISHCVKLTNAN